MMLKNIGALNAIYVAKCNQARLTKLPNNKPKTFTKSIKNDNVYNCYVLLSSDRFAAIEVFIRKATRRICILQP